MDIDPGLLQRWWSTGQLAVPPHDLYFTIGETVGTPHALIPDCGVRWISSPPPVCLEMWPLVSDPGCGVHPRDVPGLHPGLARRVERREAVVHAVPERLGE